MKFMPHSIFFTIFICFLLLFCLLIVLFSMYYYSSITDQVSELIFPALESGAGTVSDKIDIRINEMDAISSNIVHSKMISAALEEINGMEEDSETLSRYYNSDATFAQLKSLLHSATGTSTGDYQINIYMPDGNVIAYGLNNEFYDADGERYVWEDAVGAAGANRVIFYTGKDAKISRYYLSDIGKHFISFLRGTGLPREGDVVVEVEKSLLRVISDAIYYKPLYGERIILFDAYGNQIYPLSSGGVASPYFGIIKNRPEDRELMYENPDTNTEEYLIYNYSPYSGIYTVFTLERQNFTASVLRNFKQFIPIILVMVTIVTLLSLLIAKYISRPINMIYNRVKTADFTSEGVLLAERVPSNLMEINTLVKAFNLLQTRLNDANDRQMELKKQEMQARMLSLQSQMNPHFLYNSLATIQAMSDEGMNREIMIMCQTTARILRYISSDKEAMVPLKAEMAHTDDFLSCMFIRYAGDLSYDLHIPPEMEDIKIPKLCVQLLVENSVKFTSKTKPPWHISVYGTTSASREDRIWLLSIKDNGPGFTDEKLEELYGVIDEINQTNMLPSLELKGMGLLNVYIRLRLTYSDDLIFYIKSTPGSGAEVIIGGKL